MIKNIINAIKYLLYIPVYILQILFLIILFILVWVGIPMLLQGALFSIILFIPAIIDLFTLNLLSYNHYDLFARYFGMGLGTIIGLFTHLITYLGLWIVFSYFLRTRNSSIVNVFENTTKSKDDFFKNTTEDEDSEDMEEDEDDYSEDEEEDDYSKNDDEDYCSESSTVYSEDSQSENEQKEEPLSLKRWLTKKILIPFFWAILATLSCTICGFFTGYIIDSYYASHFYTVDTCPSTGRLFFSSMCSESYKNSSIDDEFRSILVIVAGTLIGVILCVRTVFLLHSKWMRNYRYSFKVFIYTVVANCVFPLALTALATWYFCQPSIPYKDKELKCGVYLYTNNTTYNVAGINIYSSRCGGFSHSGFCLITKDPRGENAQRKKLGLKPLRFTKLQRGYYVNMLSMAVPDVDGFTNYQSRCYPQENAYDFDTDALKNYLNGHSPNDLPAPALRMIKLSTDDYRKTWNRIVELGKLYDSRFPNGMVYSPVPYTDKNVKTINCNTFSGAVLDTLIKEKLINSNGKQTVKEFEKFINPRFSFGGQTMADGQKLNEFFAQDDVSEQVKCQWEYVKTTPLNEQNFWANVLRPDGSYGKSLSKLVNKPKD